MTGRGLDFSPARPARVAVLISGRGSNMLSLAAAADGPNFPAQIIAVLSDQSRAPGLARAAALGLQTGVWSGADRAAREADLTARLRGLGADLIAMAGFMRILSPDFVAAWRDRVLNIHPSLLPAFPGLDTHARALTAGVRFHGATVHLARAEVDAGPILGQAALAVRPAETAAALAARVIALEHRLYPAALAAYASGAVWASGDSAEGAPLTMFDAGGARSASDAAGADH